MLFTYLTVYKEVFGNLQHFWQLILAVVGTTGRLVVDIIVVVVSDVACYMELRHIFLGKRNVVYSPRQ